MVVLAVLAALLVAVSLHDAIRRPVLRRVALRNLTRRAGEATLVVLGSALGTAIIAGALIVGDTFDASIRDIARTDLGPIDQVVTFRDPADIDAALSAVRGSLPIEGVDGVAAVVRTRVAITTTGPNPLGEPTARVTEGDFDQLRAMGSQDSGLDNAGTTPSGDEIVLNQELADTLRAEVGDQVSVHAYGSRRDFVVRDVLPQVGIAGFGESFVAPGTLAEMASRSSTDAPAPLGLLLVSNEGGVFDSTDRTDRVVEQTAGRLEAAGLPVDQNDVKRKLLEDAAAEGDEMSELFTVVGGFSVLAGVLLLVNLFVMLAEERKTSLGVLRAVGWRRNHLIRGFVLEGTAYAVLAGALGALGGIGVGWVIVKVTERIFNRGNTGLDLRLAIEPASLVTAALAGFVISLLVIWITSWRISRLNIIRAIRDLPEPPSAATRRRSLVFGFLGIAVGVPLAVVVGIGGESAAALLFGVGLALFSSIPLLGRVVSSRAANVGVGVAVIAWSVAVFGIFSDIMTDPPIAVFLVQGVQMVAGGVAITSSLGSWWARASARMPGGAGPATQLGLVYPVARRFRTGVSLAMFSLIVFSLTFLAVLSAAFGQQVQAFVDESSAGYDALVYSNAANPVTEDQLLASDGVEAVATVLRAGPRFSAPFDEESLSEPQRWRISGIDPSFTALGTAPALAERDQSYGSDLDVFEALTSDPTLAVVATWFLGGDDGGEPAIGDQITMFGPGSAEQQLTVVGIMENDWMFAGVFASGDLVRQFLPGEYAPSVHYVGLSPGGDADAVAAALAGDFVENGVDAEAIASIVGVEVEEQQGFFSLLSGYLSLGLLIGVAGLGVVMVRAVRERRAQVGMLRAMGMPAGGVRQMFVTEGAFVALQGVVSGVVLGMLSSYQLLTRSNTFEIQLDFVVPWLAMAAIVFVPLMAAAVASAIPAGRAAAIPPAAALRLTD